MINDRHDGVGSSHGSQDVLEYAFRVLENLDERGGHASEQIAELARRERLRVGDVARLSALVYGVLRNERKLAFALEAAGASPNAVLDSRLLLAAFSVLENPEHAKTLRQTFPNLDFSRVADVDAIVARLENTQERVALFGSLPDWLAERLLADYGADAEKLASSLSEPAPRSLRVNALLSSRAELIRELEGEGVSLEEGQFSPTCLKLVGENSPFRTHAFARGAFELQDEASQLVCELVAPPPGGLVIDLCAGAGGKTLALAAQLKGRGRVIACDVSRGKLGELRKRARRAQAHNVQTRLIHEQVDDPELSDLAGRAARVLVDAPCSGSGVLRRNPEARRRLEPATLERLSATQRAILQRAAPLVAAGGRLVYVSCSLLHSEGESIADWFQNAQPAFEAVDLASIHGRAWVDRFVRPKAHMLRTLPHQHGTDGFFVTCFRRHR